MNRTASFPTVPATVLAVDRTMDVSPHLLKADDAIAAANRERWRAANVFAINVIGGPGCGKTELISATVQRLILKRRIGIVMADPSTHFDSNRVNHLGDQVIHLDPGHSQMLSAGHIQTALNQLILPGLDILLIENISSLIGPPEIDLGENAKVCIFSVAAGEDKAAKFPDVVSCANLVILNKMDLLSLMPFNTEAFESVVRRINPSAEIVKISTRTGQGLDDWFDWLSRYVSTGRSG